MVVTVDPFDHGRLFKQTSNGVASGIRVRPASSDNGDGATAYEVTDVELLPKPDARSTNVLPPLKSDSNVLEQLEPVAK